MLDIMARRLYRGHLDQRTPLARRERDDHNPPSIAGFEIMTKGTIKIIAVLRLIPASEPRLGDAAEIAHHRKRHIRQRQIDELTFARQSPMPFGSEQADRCERAQGNIPRRQDTVEWL